MITGFALARHAEELDCLMENIRKLQMSLNYDQRTDLMLVNFEKKWIFRLKLHCVIVLAINMYVNLVVFDEDVIFHINYLDKYIGCWLPKVIFKLFNVIEYLMLHTLTYFFATVSYFFAYNILYISIILKICSNCILETQALAGQTED